MTASCFTSGSHQHTPQLPQIHLAYYGFVSIRFESLQTCATHLRQASIIASSTGNFALAIITRMQSINKSFFAGKPLPSLCEDIRHQIELTVKYKDSRFEKYARIWNQTVRTLMHEEAENSSPPEGGELDATLPMIDTFHKAFQCFWKG